MKPPTHQHSGCSATPRRRTSKPTRTPLSLDPLLGGLSVGNVIAEVEETPIMAAARANGFGTADGDAMVQAAPDVMTHFLAGPWRLENGGPTRT